MLERHNKLLWLLHVSAQLGLHPAHRTWMLLARRSQHRCAAAARASRCSWGSPLNSSWKAPSCSSSVASAAAGAFAPFFALSGRASGPS